MVKHLFQKSYDPQRGPGRAKGQLNKKTLAAMAANHDVQQEQVRRDVMSMFMVAAADITRVVIESALAGDAKSAKLVMDRLVPLQSVLVQNNIAMQSQESGPPALNFNYVSVQKPEFALHDDEKLEHANVKKT